MYTRDLHYTEMNIPDELIPVCRFYNPDCLDCKPRYFIGYIWDENQLPLNWDNLTEKPFEPIKIKKLKPEYIFFSLYKGGGYMD